MGGRMDRKRLWFLCGATAVIVAVALTGLRVFQQYRDHQMMEGRRHNLLFLKRAMLAAANDQERWPASSEELLAVPLGQAPKGAKTTGPATTGGADVFSYGDRVYCYWGRVKKDVSPSSSTILLMELPTTDGDEIGVVTADGETHFVTQSGLLRLMSGVP